MADIESCGCESEPHTCENLDIADLEREIDELREDRDRTAEQLAARDAALGACAARIAELLAQVGALTERRDALLALVASISQTTPLASELEGWEGQRAALVAEVGTLRARVAEAERELAEERARLADQAAAHEDEIRRQAAVAERVATNAVKDRARAEQAERERDEARAKVEEASGLCGDLIESLRVASKTSDGYRDARAAYQRWAAKLAPDVIGDEQKRAAIDARLARPPLDPVHVAVLRGMHRRAALELAGAEHDERVGILSSGTVDVYRKRAAALEAVLGEEAKS